MPNDEFKKEYNAEMNRQKPSEQSINDLEAAMDRAARRPKGPKLRSFIALAACLALIVAFSGPVMNFAKTPQATPTSPPVAESYSELYSLLSELNNAAYRNYDYGALVKGGAVADAAAPQMEGARPASESSAETPEYSDTNLQVAGVQEADIIKTDGKYIYALSSENLYIVSAVDGELEKISEIARSTYDEDKKQNTYAFEMYVKDDRLVVLTYYNNYYIMRGAAEPDKTYSEPATGYRSIYPYYNRSVVGVEIYDISDRAKPNHLNSFSQSGSYVSSRMIGDVVYLISNESIYSEIDKDKPETFVPQVYRNGEGSLLEAQDICIAIDPKYYYNSAQYLVISGIDTGGKGKVVSTKSILGYGSTVYSSADNLYVAAYSQLKTKDDVSSDATQLYRFSLDDGNVSLEADGIVPGTIINQFAMDEYDGTFRIVTTVNSYTYTDGTDNNMTWRSVTDNRQYNALYTLDSNLDIVGSIENLAPDERVYSVRFDGDTGYFVTFRQVDPLFAVDLSDPAKPVILSELKIPGFSEYLHPFAEGLLFGLGKDADEKSGSAGYLKLSMFDISNPSNVSEANKLIIDGLYYSEASYNHKAILIDGEKNIIAFPADGKYLIYSYSSEKGFTENAVISLTLNEKDYYYYYQNMRGLYIGDYLYVVGDFGISSYSMLNYKLCGALDLTE